MHLLGLQDALPGSAYRSLTQSLPMMRAVKDADELARLAAAGAAADATYERDPQGPVRRPQGDRGRRRPRRPAAPVRARAGRLHRRRLRPERRQPAPRGRRPGDRGRRRGRARLRRADVRLRVGHHPHGVRRRAVARRSARSTRSCGWPSRRASTRSGPASPARRSTGPPAPVITEAGYGEQFIHRTGHGIGVTTHEPPYMVEGEEQPLVPGHVLLGRARDLPRRDGSASASRTSSRSPRPAAGGSTTPTARPRASSSEATRHPDCG